MPVYLDKKTNRLFIQFQHHGQTFKRRLPFGATRDKAKRLEVKLKNEIFFSTPPNREKPECLWEDFVCDVYLTHIDANQSAEALARAIAICKASMPFLKGKLLRDIKPADLELFKTSRMQTPTQHNRLRKPATIHREMSILSRAFNIAVKNDLCDYNPCSRVEMPKFDNTQDKILAPADWQKFFDGFRNSLQRDACITVLFTGLRQNDVLGLRKEHVNWQTGQIVLIQGKTQRKVRIDMNDAVKAVLWSRMDNGSPLFFPSYRKKGEQMRSIKHGIQHACQRAGVPVLTIRDLRRSFGTTLHELGYDDSTVAQLLGHSDMRSIHRYKRGTAIKKEAVDSLADLVKTCHISTTPDFAVMDADAKANKTLVEMRRVELLASALRTNTPEPKIH